jgi:hypothetical protein
VEPAEHLVEIGEPARDASGLAVTLEGGFGLEDRVGEAELEGLESAGGDAAFGEIEEILLRHLDLRCRVELDVVLVGAVDDFLADGDELSAQMQVVNRAPVILGVDDRDD